ncbi:unnamed protein product [Chironomus riparius]|uniref:Small VCP/p97-interacting protein n=1 Tax=Chironomus riparius TaxID=315576 RepID=A0A9N9WU91_9DIPT|nr:unnamed protein product [Chironomus riparius]
MGNWCGSCFGVSANSSNITPDAGTVRRQMLEAAEQRQENQQNRGIKNQDKIKRMQQKAVDIERLEFEYAIAARNRPVLKWTPN